MNSIIKGSGRPIHSSAAYSNAHLRQHQTADLPTPKLAYGTQELAELLGISTRSLKRLEERGLLVPSRALRKKLYSAKSVEAFLQETA